MRDTRQRVLIKTSNVVYFMNFFLRTETNIGKIFNSKRKVKTAVATPRNMSGFVVMPFLPMIGTNIINTS